MADQYNWVTARTELLRRLGGRNDTATVARATEWLNTSQLEMAKCFVEFPRLCQTEVITVVEGQNEYNLLVFDQIFSDLLGILSIRNDSANAPLRMYRFPWYEYRALSQQSTSQPVRWSRFGTTLALDPIPDGTYELKVDFRRRPQFETVEIDSEWHNHWINYAAFLGWTALNQPQIALSFQRNLPQWFLQQLQTPVQEDEWEAWWDSSGFQPAMCGFHP